MAYDEFLADRIRQILLEKKVAYSEKKMFGGLCFLVDDKMTCGILFDKKKNTDVMMARIGEMAEDQVRKEKGVQPMDFTGRPMKGYLYITPAGYDLDEDLSKWIQLCLDFNPFAKSSKKKK